jgi:hypothetical protein
MRRFLIALSVAMVLIFSAVAGNACGDKLLALGRGIRFQRAYKAPHPANILVFWRIDPRQPNSGKDSEFRSLLSSVGHKVTMAYDEAELGKIAHSQRFDVVIFEIQDQSGVVSSIPSVNSKPSLLPLLLSPSKADMKAAEKKYRWAVRAPVKPGKLLAAIDEAMDYRAKQGTVTLAQK